MCPPRLELQLETDAPKYNDVLEIAYSRMQHALYVQERIPSELRVEIERKLAADWVRSEPEWRARERIKEDQRERRKQRDYRACMTWADEERRRGGAPKDGRARMQVKSFGRVKEEERRRERMNREIWRCELLILDNKAERPMHSGIREEAERRYEEVEVKYLGEDPDAMEDMIREKLQEEVDAGRECSVEWEIWRLVLINLFEEPNTLTTKPDAEIQIEEDERQANHHLRASDPLIRDQARHEIFKKLFVQDLLLKPEDWEKQLSREVEYFEKQGLGEILGTKRTRAILGELKFFRMQGGFPPNFVTRYGTYFVKGGENLTAEEKRGVERRMVEARNRNEGLYWRYPYSRGS